MEASFKKVKENPNDPELILGNGVAGLDRVMFWFRKSLSPSIDSPSFHTNQCQNSTAITLKRCSSCFGKSCLSIMASTASLESVY